MTKRSILYSFCRCPYAIGARIVLLYAQIPVELREVKLRNKPKALMDVSAKATVPTLVLPNGQVIDESLDIMTWALSVNDPNDWARSSVLSLQRLGEDRDQLISLTTAYKYPERAREARHVEPTQTLDELFGHFNQHLSKWNCLVDDTVHCADALLYPFIRQIERVNPELFRQWPFENLLIWYDRMSVVLKLEKIMQRFTPWQVGDVPILFKDSP